MKLELIREKYTDESTIGKLYIDGVFECYTLEDVVRCFKIEGRTAIPRGDYKVVLTMSNRFKKIMPLILDVFDFEGVRIHSGNTSVDTSGCVLVGNEKSKNFIYESKKAFDSLMTKLNNVADITIKITDTIMPR